MKRFRLGALDLSLSLSLPVSFSPSLSHWYVFEPGSGLAQGSGKRAKLPNGRYLQSTKAITSNALAIQICWAFSFSKFNSQGAKLLGGNSLWVASGSRSILNGGYIVQITLACFVTKHSWSYDLNLLNLWLSYICPAIAKPVEHRTD